MNHLYKLTMTRVTSKVVMGHLVVEHEKECLLVESTGYGDFGRSACDLPHDGQIRASWTKLQTPFTVERVRDTETVVCVVHAVVPWEEFVSARHEKRKRQYFEDTGEEWSEIPTPPVYRSTGE